MPLLYNQETSVSRDFKTLDQENTAYLNENAIYGRSDEIQTEGVTFVHTHSWAADGTQDKTTYLPENMVLVSIFYFVPATFSCSLYVNGQEFRINASVTADEINIPNWALNEGTPIRTVFPYPAGTATAIGLTLVGRK